MPPTIDQQRDHLTRGLYLANSRFGATLDQILQAALGYDPNGSPPRNWVEPYERRFRMAQQIGRDAIRNRTPGYFTFNAMPFGHTYIYKALSYVLINSQTHQPQVVVLPSGDLASMRRLRDQDLETRQATSRNIRAAHNIEEQRQAIARRDWQALRAIQSRMIEDGSLGEILSGYHGLPYAEIQDIIPQLANRGTMFQFQRNASRVSSLQRRLIQQQNQLAQQLTRWVMIQTGVPNNVLQLVLQDAQRRLANLP